jgi:hypothetical protein
MQKGVATTPTVAEMLVIPVAGHDGILLNLSGECRIFLAFEKRCYRR